MIMNDTKKQVPVYLHLISGLITALGGWTLLKVFKVFTSSVTEQFRLEQLKMEAKIWVPAILLFAGYSWWKDNKKGNQ